MAVRYCLIKPLQIKYKPVRDPSFLGRIKIGDITWPSSYKDNLIIPFRGNFSISLSIIVCSASVKEWYGLVAPLNASQSNSIWQWVTVSKIKGSEVIFFHSWRQYCKPPALKGVWFARMLTTETWPTSSCWWPYWVFVDDCLGLCWDHIWPRPRPKKGPAGVFPRPPHRLRRPRPRTPLPEGTLYGSMRFLGVTLMQSLWDLVHSSTSLLSSSPNRKDDTGVDGLHNEAYCLFKSGRIRSLRLRINSLFDDSKRTAAWVRTFFCCPLELLHVWSTAYRPDNNKDCAFWNAEPLFLVSWRNGCQNCLFILGATKLVQFSGLRYLFCTSASLS